MARQVRKSNPMQTPIPYQSANGYRFLYFDDMDELISLVNKPWITNNGYSTFNDNDERLGRPWDEWNTVAKTLVGLEKDIQTLQDMAEELDVDAPEGTNYKRIKRWASHGTTINAQKVLRGQFSTAWRNTQRLETPSSGAVLSLVMAASFSSRTTPQIIFWSAACIAALTIYFEGMGRPCEVYTSAVFNDAYSDKGPKNGAWICKLKHAGDSWNIQRCVLPTQKEYLRRFGFRIEELSGKIDPGYGRANQAYEEETSKLLAFQGIPLETIIYGPNPDVQRVYDKQSAQQWIAQTIKSIDQF